MTLNILFPPRVKLRTVADEPSRGLLFFNVNKYDFREYATNKYTWQKCKIDSEYLLVSNIFLVFLALTVYTGITLKKEEEEAKSNSIDECHDTSIV
jgi:hypothetical protein